MAQYNLEDVKTAAIASRIEYRGLKVQRDIANLGYDINDVIDCLMHLSPANFRKTHYYDDGSLPDDDYIFRYTRCVDDEETTDKLYVKFCLVDDCLMIDLGSFHL
ncbi:hypothetical protein D5085_10470 [Ectothiorhodospiraceae bacterium BW-2]|nr:hypothetical protein D5085_10470 [Ectothiorhodospiraceae bacterium BW-2]